MISKSWAVSVPLLMKGRGCSTSNLSFHPYLFIFFTLLFLTISLFEVVLAMSKSQTAMLCTEINEENVFRGFR